MVIYEELDDDRLELRKVHEYADGHLSRTESINDSDTSLSWVPVPQEEEINLDPKFSAEAMSADEFQQVWLKASPVP